jgi:predicted butyrate kinase (DUF1464 family)
MFKKNKLIARKNIELNYWEKNRRIIINLVEEMEQMKKKK